MEHHGSHALSKSFARYRQKDFDKNTDNYLKIQGQKILDQYSPENRRVGKINAHSVFWMLASIGVFYYTDFYLAVRYDRTIHRNYFNAGILLVSITMCIAVYVICYYHYYKGITDYEKHSPVLIPVATISFLAGMICLCVGLWPLWSILTPVILFTLFMGIVFMFTVLPL